MTVLALHPTLPAYAALVQQKKKLAQASVTPFTARVNTAPLSRPVDALAPDYNALLLTVGRARDQQAFAQVFDHFAPRVKGYLLKLGADNSQAEEVLQEVILLVWRRAETFDPSKSNASTWIFTIARNRRIDWLRAMKRPEIDPHDPLLVHEAPSADLPYQESQERDQIQKALAQLPAEQADLLRLAYYEDKAHSEIAALRQLPLGTVKSRLRLALEKMRRQFVPTEGA